MQSHRQIAFQLLNELATKLNKVTVHYEKGFNSNTSDVDNIKECYRLAVNKIKAIKYELNRHDFAYAKNCDKFLMYAIERYKLANDEIGDFNYYVKCFLKKKNTPPHFSVCNIVFVISLATLFQFVTNNLSCAT